MLKIFQKCEYGCVHISLLRCERACAHPHVHFSLEKMCGCLCRCVCKKWGAGACAAHYENVCNVRVGADKNPHSKKVWICYMMTYFAPNLSHTQKVNTPSQERMRWRWRNYRLSIYVMYQGKQKWRNCGLNPKSPDYKIGWAILVE